MKPRSVRKELIEVGAPVALLRFVPRGVREGEEVVDRDEALLVARA